jgi:hypothetical protein
MVEKTGAITKESFKIKINKKINKKKRTVLRRVGYNGIPLKIPL